MIQHFCASTSQQIFVSPQPHRIRNAFAVLTRAYPRTKCPVRKHSAAIILPTLHIYFADHSSCIYQVSFLQVKPFHISFHTFIAVFPIGWSTPSVTASAFANQIPLPAVILIRSPELTVPAFGVFDPRLDHFDTGLGARNFRQRWELFRTDLVIQAQGDQTLQMLILHMLNKVFNFDCLLAILAGDNFLRALPIMSFHIFMSELFFTPFTTQLYGANYSSGKG